MREDERSGKQNRQPLTRSEGAGERRAVRRSIGSVEEDPSSGGFFVPQQIRTRTSQPAQVKRSEEAPVRQRTAQGQPAQKRMQEQQEKPVQSAARRQPAQAAKPAQQRGSTGTKEVLSPQRRSASPERQPVRAERKTADAERRPASRQTFRTEQETELMRPAARTVRRPAPASTETRGAGGIEQPERQAPFREFERASKKRAQAASPAKTGGLGIMPPISLADSADFRRPYKLAPERGEREPLMLRHEMKFYLNPGDYVVLRQQMRGILRPDEHTDSSGSYFIRSLYLDDVYNTAVTEKQAGIEFRCKYRIRIYDLDKSFIRFEKKIKTGKFISKDSFPMSYDEYIAFTNGDVEFLLHKPQPLAREVYLAMRQRLLKPCVVVDYDREPFVMNYETIRITFDRELRTGAPSWDIFDPGLPVMPLLEAGTVILEVKFARALPEYIANIINAAEGLQCSEASKYIMCRQYD